MVEHKQMYYFKTSDIQPSKADADERGQVLAYGDNIWTAIQWTSLQRPEQVKFYTHWMQMPKAPSEDDRNFF